MTKMLARMAKAGVLAVVILTASAASLGADSKYKYEGTWEGTVTSGSIPDGGEEMTWKKDVKLRLTFEKGKVSVHTGRDGEWREGKQKYQLKTLDTNAVIYSITTGRDKDGIWVETHSFVVTVVDAAHLQVMWHRQVKNKDLESSDPDAAWGVMAYGDLTRVNAPGA